MAAGLTDRPMSFEDLVQLIDEDYEARRPKTRGPYRPRKPKQFKLLHYPPYCDTTEHLAQKPENRSGWTTPAGALYALDNADAGAEAPWGPAPARCLTSVRREL